MKETPPKPQRPHVGDAVYQRVKHYQKLDPSLSVSSICELIALEWDMNPGTVAQNYYRIQNRKDPSKKPWKRGVTKTETKSAKHNYSETANKAIAAVRALARENEDLRNRLDDIKRTAS